MGDQVGELMYAVEISSIEAFKLLKKFGKDYCHQIEDPKGLILVDQPYETENFYITPKDRKANFAAYNCGEYIGSTIDVSPDWKNNIINFCEEYGVEIDKNRIGWFVIGHYN